MESAVLKQFGLKEKEARIYLASLELGHATVQDIAGLAKINRATTYVILEALIKKGLVTHIAKEKKRYFAAEPPEKFTRFLDSQIIKAKEKRKKLKKILPRLLSLHNLAAEKPKIKFYEGRERLGKLEDDFNKRRGGLMRGIFSLDDLFEVFPNYLTRYTKKRINRKINSRVIYTSKKGPAPGDSDPKKKREALYIPDPPYSIPSNLSIYGNRFALSSMRKNIFGVLIENKYITETMRSFFDLVWEGIKATRSKRP